MTGVAMLTLMGPMKRFFSRSEVAGAFTDAPHVLILFVFLFFDGTTVRRRGAYFLSSIDRWVVRYMVSLTCIHSRRALHFRS